MDRTYEIIKVISKVAYKLELPETLRIHPVFYISLLKRYNPNFFNQNNPSLSPIIIPSTSDG